MDFQRIKRLAVFSGPKSEGQTGTRRRYLRIAGIAVGAVVLILLLIPLFINVNSFRPKVESEASAAFGRQVTLGNLSLSLLSGSVGADNITIADDPAFSKSPFVTAKSLKIGVELMPLIFSKQLNVTDVTLEEPQITLLKAANGRWNFSSIGGGGAQKEQPKSGESKKFSIAKLNVNRGKVSVGKASSAGKQAVYDDVNITVTDFSFTSQFPFQLTAQLPGGGDANVSGKAGAINANDASKTPLEATVKVNNMTFAGLGMVVSVSLARSKI
jgi:AsmA protein